MLAAASGVLKSSTTGTVCKAVFPICCRNTHNATQCELRHAMLYSLQNVARDMAQYKFSRLWDV